MQSQVRLADSQQTSISGHCHSVTVVRLSRGTQADISPSSPSLPAPLSPSAFELLPAARVPAQSRVQQAPQSSLCAEAEGCERLDGATQVWSVLVSELTRFQKGSSMSSELFAPVSPTAAGASSPDSSESVARADLRGRLRCAFSGCNGRCQGAKCVGGRRSSPRVTTTTLAWSGCFSRGKRPRSIPGTRAVCRR